MLLLALSQALWERWRVALEDGGVSAKALSTRQLAPPNSPAGAKQRQAREAAARGKVELGLAAEFLSLFVLLLQVSTRILGRRTATFPPFLIPSRVPHGFTQDPSTDPKILVLLLQKNESVLEASSSAGGGGGGGGGGGDLPCNVRREGG